MRQAAALARVGAATVTLARIWHGGKVVGWVTSGGYAHNAARSVAMGYVPKAVADKADGFEIELLGKRHRARLQPGALFDADFKRMRG